jgi:hypothetical protein
MYGDRELFLPDRIGLHAVREKLRLFIDGTAARCHDENASLSVLQNVCNE